MALTQISTAGVKDDAVTSGKIPANAVGSSELADNAVDTDAIADDAVTAVKIVANAVGASEIANDSVGTNALTNNAVQTANIADDAVTSAKIANNAITTALINNAEVTNAKLAANAVTADKINNGEISTAKIADNAVTNSKLASGAVGTNKLASGAVGSGEIAAGSIVNSNISSSAAIAKSKLETFVNNNADNRVITGSGTANTLNGESSVVIDANSNVGIGTTSPSTNLHVKGPDGSAPKITLSEGTSESAIRSTASGTSSDLRLMTSVSGTQTTKLIVDYSGKVGIGTTSPVELLTVQGSQLMTGTLKNNSSTSPQQWTSNGRTGTYNQSVMYVHANNTSNNSSNGIVFEVGRLSDSSTAEIGKFTIATRGGAISTITDADGIKFNGDTAAANGLDDYEEGTYNPTAVSANGLMTMSYSGQIGYYTKIGRQVTVYGFVRGAAGGTQSNIVHLGGLPFNVRLGYSQCLITDTGDWTGYTTNHSGWGGYGQVNSNHIVMLSVGDKNSQGINCSTWGSSTYVYYNMTYFTDS